MMMIRSGDGSACGHHGELLQGAFRIRGGEPVHALITLPFREMVSRATFLHGTSELVVTPTEKVKAKRAAELALACLGKEAGGTLTVTSNIPLGRGFGSSTSDVVAAIRAVYDVFGMTPSDHVLASLAVRAEGASDSTMYEKMVLFAQREGRVLEILAPAYPDVLVVGVDSGHNEPRVDTLAFPVATYTPSEIDYLDGMLHELREGLRRGDVRSIGSVASASAGLNQRYLEFADFAALEELVEHVGALGVQAAHTGRIAGILLDPAAPDCRARAAEAREALHKAGLRTWCFSTGSLSAALGADDVSALLEPVPGARRATAVA
jgi:uncharacterized protein involved in propanediol utilization